MEEKLNSKDAFTKRVFGRLMRVWLQSTQGVLIHDWKNVSRKFDFNKGVRKHRLRRC